MAKAWRQNGKRRRLAAAAALWIAMSGWATAMDGGPHATDPWRDWVTGIAIGGYDPVAYFVHHSPRLGEARYELMIDGVAWRFANAGNRAAFARDRHVYAPRYGGRDPVRLGDGFAAEGNPLHWVIEEGDLYLFVSPQTRAQWLKADPRTRAAADANWPRAVKVTQ